MALLCCAGNAKKGVSLSKHADVLLRKRYDDGLKTCWMIIFKVGRITGSTVLIELQYKTNNVRCNCFTFVARNTTAEKMIKRQWIKQEAAGTVRLGDTSCDSRCTVSRLRPCVMFSTLTFDPLNLLVSSSACGVSWETSTTALKLYFVNIVVVVEFCDAYNNVV